MVEAARHANKKAELAVVTCVVVAATYATMPQQSHVRSVRK